MLTLTVLMKAVAGSGPARKALSNSDIHLPLLSKDVRPSSPAQKPPSFKYLWWILFKVRVT